jgi:type I restriction enzyme S subunit
MTATCNCKLSEVCIQDRRSIKLGQLSGLRYVGLESIESNTGVFIDGVLSKTPEAPKANSFHFTDKHVLYGKLRPYLNKVALPEFEGKCSTEIIPLLPGDNLNREYLAYFLRSAQTVSQISEKTTGARMPRADMHFVLSLEIPLPSLADQHRIVNILKRADSIRRLRKQAQDTARQLIPALYIDMFGDPATNPKEWPIRKVSDFVQRFEGGKNLKAGTDTPRNYRILKVSAVTSGIYKENESKPSPDEYSPPEKYYVREGDLLFSRANTEALVGATALVEKTNAKTLLPDKLWRFVLTEEVEPIYVYALFQSPYVRQELSKLSTGTSASMREFSQAKLKTLKLPVPPYEEQKQFAARVRQVQAVQMQQSIALDTATDTFKSVLSRAFNGYL